MFRKTILASITLALALAGAQSDRTPPKIIARSNPAYSEEARVAKIEGSVMLSVVIGADGLAHDINVIRKLGNGLDEKAVEAVQKWKWEPGTKDGQPVSVRAQIEVNFRLQ